MASQDQYTAKSKDNEHSAQEKIDDLKKILDVTKVGMLTTRCSDGNLHSRAMAHASYESLHFFFIGNNASDKFDEIKHDSHVNVSFYDASSTNWVSIAGVAKLRDDKELVKKLWNFYLKAWFGDLGDGKHKGDANDPRVGVIEVVPEDICYWWATRSKIGQAIEVATSAVTGNVASPGELRTISRSEIRLVETLHV